MRQSSKTFNRVTMALVFLFLYAPIFLLIVFSFNQGESNSVWEGFSLHWYRELFNDRLIMRSVYTTLLVSLLATVIATIAGTFAAVGFYSLRRRTRNVLNTVNNIPMMNADIVTGVAMCLFFVAFFALWKDFAIWVNGIQNIFELPTRLTLGFGTLLIAHITFNIPYIILSVGPKLRQLDKNLVDAAMDLGCTWMQAFFKVILPEIKPGIVSGALTAFTMSIDDFIISYFTSGSSSSTLAMTIYGMTKKRVTPEINAISTLLFICVILLLAVINIREARMEQQNQQKKLPTTAEAAARASAKHKKRGPVLQVATGVLAVAAVVALMITVHGKAGDRVVNVCSWGEYIDESLIAQFEEETGITVNYQTVESNEALYSLLKIGAGDYDVVVPSDYMISRLIEEGMLEELDYSNIPNFDLIDDRFKNLSYDPENKYTVPYTWGTVGIIYNRNMVDEEITSWSAMFDDKYADSVLLINNSRDALGFSLMSLGYSLNTTDEAQIREAYEKLVDANKRGVYQGKVMDEVFGKMEGGNAAIATYYAGDYLSMADNQADNVDLAFVVPDEGSNWFVDAMCVLKDAPNKEEAEAWINFLASTEASLANMDYIWYASPNKEALEQYPAYYEELYGEELDMEVYEIMAAPQEVLDRCESYVNLPEETLALYNDLWIELGIN